MPYKVGTLCYIKGDHDCAGMTCTITDPLMERFVEYVDGCRFLWCYRVDIPSAPPPPKHCSGWAAKHEQLIPISPPDCDIDQKTDVPAHA